jgi:hypothetical protein
MKHHAVARFCFSEEVILSCHQQIHEGWVCNLDSMVNRCQVESISFVKARPGVEQQGNGFWIHLWTLSAAKCARCRERKNKRSLARDIARINRRAMIQSVTDPI